MEKEKRYEFDINVKFTEITHAKNKKQAIKQVKDTFKQDYNLELTDEEIISIR